jgi:transposase
MQESQVQANKEHKMSQPNALGSTIPADTVRVAQASFRKGNPLLRLRDEHGVLFDEADFSDLYAWKGEAGISAALLATVTLLQYVEGLSDRQAAQMVCSRIDWKYLLGVELSYSGFDQSVLSEFRSRLLAHQAAERLFEKPLARLREQGLVKERGQQRTDSTQVLAAIRVLNRVELVGETLRHALNQLAIEGRGWLLSWAPAEWFDRYSSRIEEAKLPSKESERQALVETIGRDGYQLLTVLLAPETPAFLKALPAVQVLWLVWLQQYEQVDEQVCWRASGNVPSAERMVNSPYDPQARYSRKRQTTWTGYKVHLTESCDDDLPHIITHVETTPATEPDCQTLPKIHQALDEKALLPAEHLVDAGYVAIAHVVTSQQTYAMDLCGPMRPDSSWQARQQTGYDIAHFVVDWQAETVTCPQGHTSHVWSPTTNQAGDAAITVRFRAADCRACPLRTRCTQAETAPRALHLQPTQQQHELLQQRRREQLEPPFQQRYRRRAGIEGTISQGTRALGLRCARFIGEEKTRLQHLATAAALNCLRLAAWLLDHDRARTRVSAFAELAPPPLPNGALATA